MMYFEDFETEDNPLVVNVIMVEELDIDRLQRYMLRICFDCALFKEQPDYFADNPDDFYGYTNADLELDWVELYIEGNVGTKEVWLSVDKHDKFGTYVLSEEDLREMDFDYDKAVGVAKERFIEYSDKHNLKNGYWYYEDFEE